MRNILKNYDLCGSSSIHTQILMRMYVFAFGFVGFRKKPYICQKFLISRQPISYQHDHRTLTNVNKYDDN